MYPHEDAPILRCIKCFPPTAQADARAFQPKQPEEDRSHAARPRESAGFESGAGGISGKERTPVQLNDRDEPAAGAGCDYKVFVAARKWRETLLSGYFCRSSRRFLRKWNSVQESEPTAPASPTKARPCPAPERGSGPDPDCPRLEQCFSPACAGAFLPAFSFSLGPSGAFHIGS